MWDKAVDDLLAALKLIRDCFITSKLIKELFAALYADEFDEDDHDAIIVISLMAYT